MKEIHYKRWEFYADVEATREAYSLIKGGGAEECGCNNCLNFVAARDIVYPQEVLELFEQLGIDYRKEIEVCHICKIEIGEHLYEGWLHFIGSFKSGESLSSPKIGDHPEFFEQIDGNFQIGFTENVRLYWNEFNGKQLIQLEFAITIPWMLKEIEEPSN
jgi:hypothetical protein